jgi:adenylate kinase family enzyme
MGFDTNKWFKRQYLMEAGLLENEEADKIHDLIYDANPSYSNLAKALATILKDEYGSHNFSPFMEVLHAELGMEESLNEVADDFYPDSPEALSAATAKAKEILDKHKASIKAIADKYEGQANKSREMMDELNALIDVDLEDVPFQDYVSNKVKGTLGKALFRYYAQKNPELAKIMR